MTKPERRVTTPLRVFMKYLSILMVLLYIGLGLVILTDGGNIIDVPDAYIMPLGLGLLGYGLFRCYRVYVYYFRNP